MTKPAKAQMQLRTSPEQRSSTESAGGDGAGASLKQSVRGASFAEGEAALSPGVKQSQVQRHVAQNKPVQRLAHKGVPIDIATLDKPQCGAHIGRIIRKGKGIDTGDDADYTYDPADLGLIKQRQEDIKGQEAKQKELEDEADKQQVVAYLFAQLTTLASAGAFNPQPPWIAKNVPAPKDNETYHSGPKPGEAVAAWKAFLGGGPYTNLDPHTGLASPCRLTSADGTRAIRYSSHERNSTANLHHYHEETYTFDGNTTLSIQNHNKRMPINSAARDKAFPWK